MERLASGKRINSAADDAAGMAVAAKMRADISSLNQAVRNTNDAISLVNTYDGAAQEIENILIRMRELAVQANNGTYENADRVNANYEYAALKEEIKRIADVTAFNRRDLGTSAAAAGGFSFYVGSDVAKTGNTVSFMGANSAGSAGLNLNDEANTLPTSALKHILSAGDATGASGAIAAIDTAIGQLNGKRAQAGALINRLEHTVSNLMNVSQRLQEAVSGIEDADYASESANLARGMVLAQAGTAMLAQANQAPQYILSLLRG
jgi:flagellin